MSFDQFINKNLLVLTPAYPNETGSYIGDSFVKNQVDELKKYFKEHYKDKSPVTLYVGKTNTIQFFRWLYSSKKEQNNGKLKKKEDIDCIAWIQLKRSDKDKLPEEILVLSEINKLASVCDNFRDKAIVKTLYETGARVGEFLQLQIKHLQEDEHGMVCILPKGKTMGRRLRLINCVPDLKHWLNNHPNKDDPNSPLFVNLGSHKGRGLYTDGLKMLLKKYADRIKLKKRIYPHLFRHSRATDLAKQGFREAELRYLFGWSVNSDMPSKYIHLAGGDIEAKLLALNGNDEMIDQAKKDAEMIKAWKCPRCKEGNASEDKYCFKCGWDKDLDYKTFMLKEEETADIKEQMAQMLARFSKMEDLMK